MTDLASLSTALSDRYRIERELGAGGMATVYPIRRRINCHVPNKPQDSTLSARDS